jgi:hypothetical protein
MSVLHVVDRPHDLVLTSFFERVTLDEIATACTKLRHDHDFRPHYSQLADLSTVSNLDLRLEDLSTIRMTYDPFSNQSRRAFVVPDPDTLEKVKTYQSLLESEHFGVFPSLLDAISWLDLEVTVLQAAYMRSHFRWQPAEDEPGLTFDLPAGSRQTFRRMHRSKAHRGGNYAPHPRSLGSCLVDSRAGRMSAFDAWWNPS